MAANGGEPWRVLVTRSFPEAGLSLLREEPNLEVVIPDEPDASDAMPYDKMKKLLAEAPGYDALLCFLTDKIDAELLDAAGSRLKTVSTMSVGYNHMDVAACTDRKLSLGHTPDVLTNTVADFILGVTIATCRRIPAGVKVVKDDVWGKWAPLYMCGRDVHHATVGIMGLGRIGMAVAKRLAGFDCEILYSDAFRMDERAATVGATYVEFDDLLARSDIVIPLCPLTAETTGLFDAEAFGKMKKTAVLINCSRGEIVNQDALYDALKDGTIWAAGLDVTVPEPLPASDKLVGLENCMIVPHMASATVACREDMARIAARNVIAAHRGDKLPHAVPGDRKSVV